jgi:hypothetical protein
MVLTLLTTALVGAVLPKDVPEGHMVRSWLDSWSGLGRVVQAMHHVGDDVRVSQSPFCWTADFCRDKVSQLPLRFAWNHDATPLAGGATGRAGDTPAGPVAMKSPARKPDPAAPLRGWGSSNGALSARSPEILAQRRSAQT